MENTRKKMQKENMKVPTKDRKLKVGETHGTEATEDQPVRGWHRMTGRRNNEENERAPIQSIKWQVEREHGEVWKGNKKDDEGNEKR